MNNWTNVLLAALLAFELATGLYGLVSGAPDREFILILHNIGAFAIIAIAGWKVLIVAGSLRRRSGGPARIASLTLASLVLIAFGFGLAWSLNGFFRIAGITGLNWHMFAAIAALPIAIWHALKYTRRLRIGFNADRRAAIKLGGALAAGTGLWLVYEGFLKQFDLAGASRRFTGSHEYSGPGANAFPNTSWLNDRPRPVDLDSWRLHIDGNVSKAFALEYRRNTRFADLVDHRNARLHGRVVRQPHLARRTRVGPARHGGHRRRRPQRHVYVRDRVLPARLDGRVGKLHTGDARG